VVQNGTLHPKAVKVPGILVDHVVVGRPENHMQTMGTQFNRAYTGDVRIPTGSTCRRCRWTNARSSPAAPRWNCAMAPSPTWASACPRALPRWRPRRVCPTCSLSIETGVIGGVPAAGDFGLAYNPESAIEQSYQFDFYDGGGLDAASSAWRRWMHHGNVNVSKFSGRPVGCGGFINITRSTKNLVFCGSLHRGRLEDSRSATVNWRSCKEGRARSSSARSSRSPSTATTR
jgi:propionate CoA-transferase